MIPLVNVAQNVITTQYVSQEAGYISVGIHCLTHSSHVQCIRRCVVNVVSLFRFQAELTTPQASLLPV